MVRIIKIKQTRKARNKGEVNLPKSRCQKKVISNGEMLETFLLFQE